MDTEIAGIDLGRVNTKCYRSEINATALLRQTLTLLCQKELHIIARPAYHVHPVTNEPISNAAFFRMIIITTEESTLFSAVKVLILFDPQSLWKTLNDSKGRRLLLQQASFGRWMVRWVKGLPEVKGLLVVTGLLEAEVYVAVAFEVGEC